MQKVILAAAALAGAIVAAEPASAMPVARIVGDEVGSLAENVAWYCNGRGHCVQGYRSGYVVRQGWAPACGAGYYWGGYSCAVVVRRPAVVYRPGVVYRPRGVVVIR
jgi:hypothetical protein